jgi:hypothetical protein
MIERLRRLPVAELDQVVAAGPGLGLLERAAHGQRRGVEEEADTLKSATSLAADHRALGQAEVARALDEDTLERRRRVLGPHHPDTLSSARSLAADG